MNRVALMDRLAHTLAVMKRHRSRLAAVLFVDLDNFKEINDSFGHDAGDLVLIEIGQQLREDTLKIDRSFVQHVTRSHRDQQVVAAVIAMAHALDMTVVAEGVENGQQLSVLRLLGCELGQGNFLAAPMAAAALARRVHRPADGPAG